jgi:hypothetical protein
MDLQQVPKEFRQRLHQLTVDQLAHEQTLAQEAVKEFQSNFSEEQLRNKKSEYSQVCKTHEALFDIPHKHGLLTTMKQ